MANELTIVSNALSSKALTPAVIEECIAALENVSFTTEMLQDPGFADAYDKMSALVKAWGKFEEIIKNKSKDALEANYMETGVQTITNGKFSLTYKPETTRESIDSVRLKKEKPEIYREFIKVSPVKSSVTIKSIKEKEN